MLARLPSPEVLKAEGLCPLMPEETVLMLAALGFNRQTRIFLAGAHIYGGSPRLTALTTLFPNLVTKENLLSASEIEPFMKFSSQVTFCCHLSLLPCYNFVSATAINKYSLSLACFMRCSM